MGETTPSACGQVTKSETTSDDASASLCSAINGVAATAATRHDSPHPSLAHTRSLRRAQRIGIRFADMHDGVWCGSYPLSKTIRAISETAKRAWRDGAYGIISPRAPAPFSWIGVLWPIAACLCRSDRCGDVWRTPFFGTHHGPLNSASISAVSPFAAHFLTFAGKGEIGFPVLGVDHCVGPRAWLLTNGSQM